MSNRASYQHISNIHLGQSSRLSYLIQLVHSRVKVSSIGVKCPSTGRIILRMPYTEHNIRNIALQNANLSALTLAVDLASGRRVNCVYASSTCGMARQSVTLVGLE